LVSRWRGAKRPGVGIGLFLFERKRIETMKLFDGLKPYKIVGIGVLGFLFLLMFVVFPLVFFFAPSILKSLFALALLQQLTILVINYTGWDVWLARAVGFALIWVPSLFVLRFIGGFITPGMVFIKKGRRGLFIAGGLCMFLAMHFISKNVNFSPITGEPLKKYVRHSDCSVELFPVEMEYDPYFGDPLCIPINPTSCSGVIRPFIGAKRRWCS